MSIDEQTLRAIPEFSLLSDEELVQVRSLIRERQVQRGEILFFEGEPGEWLYSIRSGRVKVFKTSADGKEQVLRIFHAGETFNDVPVFDGGPIRPAQWS